MIMPGKDGFNMQFRGGYFPQEPYGETRIPLYREAESPSPTRKMAMTDDHARELQFSRRGQEEALPGTMRKRQGLALGTEEQARPGMVGKQDRARKK
jgi:hypothetical protein